MRCLCVPCTGEVHRGCRYCGIAVCDDDEPDGGNGARLCMQELDEMEVAMN